MNTNTVHVSARVAIQAAVLPCNGKHVPDPLIKVRPVGQREEWVEWAISQNLTDRWGEINDADAANKPLKSLEKDDELLERLRAQMWDESTFVVRKDGTFGILFEVEYCSQESEEGSAGKDEFKPHEVVVKALLAQMTQLAEKFPGVLFAVPHEAEVYNGRPAAWAFVADGLLSESQRAELGSALLAL